MPDRFADVPLDRVQAIAAIGQVSDPDVLARREQIAKAHGDERAEWNLKGQCVAVPTGITTRGAMQVHRIVANADAVGKCSCLRTGRVQVAQDILLPHRRARTHAATLANVRRHRQSVRRPQYVGTQPQPGPPRAAVGAWGFSLQPVQQAETERFRRAHMLSGFGGAHASQRAKAVVVLPPVHERDVTRILPGRKERSVDDAPV